MFLKTLLLKVLETIPVPLPLVRIGRRFLSVFTARHLKKAVSAEPPTPQVRNGRDSLVDLNRFWFGGGKQKVAAVGSRYVSGDRKKLRLELSASLANLEAFVEERASEVAIIVGNGPSLQVESVEEAARKGADPFISNYAFLDAKLRESAKVHSVVNYLIAEQARDQIEAVSFPLKIIPWWLSYCVDHRRGFALVDTQEGLHFQSTLGGQGFSWAHTVSFFNIQMAVALGYRKLILVGMDNRYDQPKDASEGEILLGSTFDTNHFHPNYFSGKKWQAASPELMAHSFRLAEQFADHAGVEIVDCTVNGNLQEFRKSELDFEL